MQEIMRSSDRAGYGQWVKVVPIGILLLLFVAMYAHAGWTGPTEVVSGLWGAGPGQFGKRFAEGKEIVPRVFAVSPSGRIAVADEQAEERIQIFDRNGKVERVLPVFATVILFGSHDELLVSGGRFAKYRPDGERDWEFEGISYDALYELPDGDIIAHDNGRNTYYRYSRDGVLRESSVHAPLDIGRLSETRNIGGRVWTVIAYPDGGYSIPVESAQGQQARHDHGELSAASGRRVFRYGRCGREIGRLGLPERATETMQFGGSSIALEAGYGGPVLARNGDVYAWKQTKYRYAIVRWSWRDEPEADDGPDAPSDLEVKAAKKGLVVAWRAPAQDPGCVTGYEIVRARSAKGPYSSLASVKAGTMAYTDAGAKRKTAYFYQVRAVAGRSASAYSEHASGRR